MEEDKLRKMGYKKIAGIDEAGRGPLAGPVVAAAVVVTKNIFKKDKKSDILLEKVKDSKKLSFLQRDNIYKKIIKCLGITWSVAVVSEKIIDKINYFQNKNRS